MTKKLEWRENLHKTILKILYKGTPVIHLPQIIIDAIDAAYVQGLEDRVSLKKRTKKKTLEEILREVEKFRYITLENQREAGWNDAIDIVRDAVKEILNKDL